MNISVKYYNSLHKVLSLLMIIKLTLHEKKSSFKLHKGTWDLDTALLPLLLAVREISNKKSKL